MIDRIASMLLAVALITAGSSTPFAHLHPQGEGLGVERPGRVHDHTQSAHEHGQGTHWHPVGSQTVDRQSSAVSGKRHRDVSVSLDTVAVERLGARVGFTPALAEAWEARVVPDPLEGSVTVASNARPNPPPPGILAARAPPL